ncbi:MAG: SMC-Scp complex subunit ScpB [Halobacteriovoraceae bacterium]|nr:SMC-Scp complex subunit ScpB [Halobacteriovoraceae bacterium]
MSVIDYSWDFSKEEFNLDLDFFNEKEQEDKMWQARTGLDHVTLCAAIETIIFMSDRPVNLQKIKNQIDTDLPLRVVHESIAKLQSEYELKHHGIRLMEVAQGYQFRTKATYAKIVQNMFKVQSLQLSPTAIEVLAIIAYKQPISKTAVESIRGVDSSHIVRALMDRRLVKMSGRSDEVGRPSLYSTTTEFLEVFNVNSVDDLPSMIELDELARVNEVGEISDIKNIIQKSSGKKFDADELIELDNLSSSIKDITSETSFTKSLKDMDKVRKTDDGVEKKSAFDILEEYVNKAQIIEQNKSSLASETLTSVMEPKSVALNMLNEVIFNAPEILADEDEKLSLNIENVEPDFTELDSSTVREIEAQADKVLEKSEELIDSIINPAVETQEVHLEVPSLEDEIDTAFDLLLDESTPEVEQSSAEVEESFGELDISSFISAKIAQAEVENIEEAQDILDEANDKVFSEISEEEALEQELDDAFANLTGESAVEPHILSKKSIEDISLDLE